MKKSKPKRITKAMIDAQSEILDEIAKRRGTTRKHVLYEAVKTYTWAYLQERGLELRTQTK